MANRITEAQKEEINEIFAQCGIKSEVAKRMGISAASVSKYLIPNYVPKEFISDTPFNSPIREVPIQLFLETEDWGDLCVLSQEEKEECDELRKEIIY